VEEALRRAEGAVVTVSDDEILDAWRRLAHEEGLFCEPASAAGVAGLEKAGLEPGTRVVCIITGNGLKDPETAARLSPPPIAVDPDPDAIAAAA
jgi:threonine synthase